MLWKKLKSSFYVIDYGIKIRTLINFCTTPWLNWFFFQERLFEKKKFAQFSIARWQRGQRSENKTRTNSFLYTLDAKYWCKTILKFIEHDYKKIIFACDLNERATTQFILIGTNEKFFRTKVCLTTLYILDFVSSIGFSLIFRRHGHKLSQIVIF